MSDEQISAALAELMDKRSANVYAVLPTHEGWVVILTWPYRGGGTAAPDEYVHGYGTGVVAALSNALAKAKEN